MEIELEGEVPSALSLPSGCCFRTRCPLAFERCAAERPRLQDVGGGQSVACHPRRRTGKGPPVNEAVIAEVVIVQARLPLADPHDCTDAADELALYEALYDTLVRREGKGYAPRLAVSWEVSDDARTWTFRIRAGVAFHDGAPCDADAVRLSLQRIGAGRTRGQTLGAARGLAATIWATPTSRRRTPRPS